MSVNVLQSESTTHGHVVFYNVGNGTYTVKVSFSRSYRLHTYMWTYNAQYSRIRGAGSR